MKFIVGMVLVVGLVLSVPIFGIGLNTGSGEHTGYVTAVDVNGIIWRTPTVYIKTKLESSQEDKYCVADDSVLVNRLKDAAVNQERVTVNYESELQYGAIECNGESEMVTSIK